MLVHALALLINQRLAADIERYSGQAHIVVFPPPCPQPVQAWDFSQAATLIDQGYQSANRVLSGEESAEHWHGVALAHLRLRDA
jgi:NTE family protein